MSEKKVKFGVFLDLISKSLNIPKEDVKTVIKSYNEFAVNSVSETGSFNYGGVVFIKVTGQTIYSFTPIEYQYKVVSEKYQLSLPLVKGILEEYFSMIKDYTLDNYSVSVFGIGTLKINNTGTVRCKGSNTMVGRRVTVVPYWNTYA